MLGFKTKLFGLAFSKKQNLEDDIPKGPIFSVDCTVQICSKNAMTIFAKHCKATN
jgi:hypothetical protein